MIIKKNDKVKIIAGKDKGKIGKVMQVFPDKKRVSVEGVNLLIKHIRARKSGEKGQRIEFPAAMNISNMMLLCPKCGKPTRVAQKIMETGTGENKTKKKIRICKKCQEPID